MIPNNSISPGKPGFPEAGGAGGTVIYGPGGRVLPAYQQYVPRYSPGLQDAYLPTDFEDAPRYFASKRHW